jgi:hypothetical protein
LITTLIGRTDLVIVLEHPESLLHPHATRLIGRMIRRAAESNQVVVITHDPRFVEPAALTGLRRFVWTPTAWSTAKAFPDVRDKRTAGQIETALRLLHARELLFGRAALFVEDESVQRFIRGVAPGLEFDLDSLGVSVIPVEGHDGYAPFITVAKSLSIPFVALRDKAWPSDREHPPDTYFSLGMELEQFLDQAGLHDLREEVARDVGTSKRRVAAALAARLTSSQVPPLFKAVLERATMIAGPTTFQTA